MAPRRPPASGSLAELLAALGDPAFHPHRPARVDHVQTHISHVFLAGAHVYKLKKPVRFPFLDFSTVELRQRACADEIELNRRLSPAVYLDVVWITRAPDGRLRPGGEGERLEPLVWMRRLPADAMLAERVRRGAIEPAMLTALAARIAAFHAAAAADPAVAAYADPERLAAGWAENLDGAVPFAGELLPAEDLEVLRDFGPGFVRRHETLLRARQRGGRVVEGHGDLHAEHVYFLEVPLPAADGLPPLAVGIYVVDGVEFSRPLRCIDVASEVAFLAMDLEAMGRPDLAAGFVADYARATGDDGLGALLPFYVAHRACVRGKVEGLASVEPEVEPAARADAAGRARRHFALAVRGAWRADGPVVIVCCGLSGSGKTTLAAELAGATGFVHLSSDVLRRERDGAGGPQAWASGRYTAAARDAVYRRLEVETDAALGAGQGVIADATFLERAARDRLAAVTRRRHRPHVFVECRAAEATIRDRLAARASGASLSDARWSTYLAQRDRFEPLASDEPAVVVDTSAGLAAARAAAVRVLWPWRRGRPLSASSRGRA